VSIDLCGDGPGLKKSSAVREMHIRAARLGVGNFGGLVRALAMKQLWSRDQALASGSDGRVTTRQSQDAG
jgi:hypothetical protein